jgi:hypothetical protein
MLEDISKVLSDILAADTMSYWIVGALAVLGTVIMRSMLPSKMLAIVFLPGIFWGGLAGIYAATYFGLVVTTERSAQIVISGTAGMGIALCILVLAARAVDSALRIRKPLTHGTARV